MMRRECVCLAESAQMQQLLNVNLHRPVLAIVSPTEENNITLGVDIDDPRRRMFCVRHSLYNQLWEINVSVSEGC